MGRRGPAPTPTPILKLRGSTRATRRDRRSNPEPCDGLPAAPKWLTKDAQSVWKEVSQWLASMGLGTIADTHALARYCHLWVRWRQCEDFIREHGETYTIRDENGKVRYVQQWPQVAIAHRIAHNLTRLEQEFGLTPAARTRINVDKSGGQTDEAKKAAKYLA